MPPRRIVAKTMKVQDHSSTAIPFAGVVQHYAWGGHEFIPRLLRLPVPQEEPYAELWMGAHPKGPGRIAGSRETLQDRIAAHPRQLLGPSVADRFAGRLPFLFKVLDAADMLSIQVHPTKEAAERGYAAEEQNGPPRDAPDRNYRDDNHKPELGIALTDFYLLHGFRSEAAIRATLQRIPAWQPLESILSSEGVAGLYEYVMRADRTRINELLGPLADTLGGGGYRRHEPEFWARRAIEQYSTGEDHDRGIFSIYWFNLVHLRPGQGIFQDAGLPHAYLEGACMELMANSDNVLRGGLTPKHIDVNELLKHTRTEAITPQILTPGEVREGLFYYPTPAPDFSLYRAAIGPGEWVELSTFTGPVVAFLLDGTVAGSDVELGEHQRCGFFPAGYTGRLTARADSRLFLATVGE